MLVLSRKEGERIHIGDGVFVEVRRIKGNQVSLGIQAPQDVKILRGELKDGLKLEEQEAPLADASV